MGAIEDRMDELSLSLPAVPAPVAAYIPAVATSNLVLTSGQQPYVDGVQPRVGKVGAEVDAEEATGLAAICALNALAAAASVIGSLDRVTRVVKLTAYVASAPDFTGQPAVANGASALLGDVFGELGRHARAAVGVAVLPLNSPVEVDLVLEFA